jgi:hypothetical protein
MEKKAKESGLESVISIEEDDNILVKTEEGYYNQPLFIKNYDNKEWVKFINTCKRIIRSSSEYKTFVSYCKQEFNCTNCAFLPNVNDEFAEVEIHHAILNLHDIVEIIADHLTKKGNTTSLEVCHEVIKSHFAGMVSVVPLSKVVHDLVHEGKINISINQVYGNCIRLLEKYPEGITDIHLEKIRIAYKLSKRELIKESLLEIRDFSEYKLNSIDSKALQLSLE